MSAGVDAPSSDRRRRIALVSGICVRHDAISNVVRAQEEILASAGYDVRVYVQHTDFPGGRHHAVSDPWLLQRDDWYTSADLVVLHFGINYGLFDSLGLTHRGVRVVHFHNVTPPDLLHGEARDAAVRGIDQLNIAARADRIWSDSEYNTRCLLEWTDVDPAKVDLMQLCTPWAEAAPSDVGPPARAVERGRRVIAVGRLVPAKGQMDLIEAVAALGRSAPSGLQVDLIGGSDGSDSAYVGELEERIAALGLDRTVHLSMDLSDEELRERYHAAALFVSPSRHEGFCVPVIEALSAGCRVIATDAGALPETVGPCGQIVPVGDVQALSEAIGRALDEPDHDAASRSSCQDHLVTFGRPAFRRRLLESVQMLLEASTPEAAAP